ncbi:hypothetical protein AK812_SmicGene34692 [Symbiodinium microadriaticum]|uniref:Uncharacterized protein n=1 Tax=Symbiodinium microadriaticum TaxID=2951 RepID=A0A1Q9CND1_SYMMI|nr:hypothetical protein AK812_SmicGene34692 [Symbiodinium microadriaticum]
MRVAQAAQQAALAAPPPPPPPPPPGGEMSSAVDAFLSQGAPANPSAASAVDAYLQQGTAAPVENPFAPGGARPGFGAGAFGPGGGSTSLTLGPVGGCGGGFGCGAAGGSTSLTLGPVGGGCGGGFGCGGCGGGLGGCGGCGGGLGGGFGNLGGCGCGSGLGGGCEGSGPIGGGGGGQVDPARAMQAMCKTLASFKHIRCNFKPASAEQHMYEVLMSQQRTASKERPLQDEEAVIGRADKLCTTPSPDVSPLNQFSFSLDLAGDSFACLAAATQMQVPV